MLQSGEVAGEWTEHGKQRGLAAAGRTRHQHEAARGESQRHIPQRVNRGRPGTVGERHTLRSQTPEGVEQELYGVLLGYYAVRALMLQSAEQVGLDSVLVTNWKLFGLDAAAKHIGAAIDENRARPVRRRVERYLDFNTPARPEDIHALIWNQLRAACKQTLA